MGKRILVVEDEKSVREGLMEALLDKGYEPFGVVSGEEALKELRREPWALCILDVKLPGESGFWVCKKLREVSNTPVLFLTAFSDEANVVRGLELGGDDYVAKPFRLKELLSRVQALIRRSECSGNRGEGGEGEGRDSGGRKQYWRSDRFRLNLKNRKLERNGEELLLTPKECQMVYLFMEAWPGAVSREELVRAVWDRSGQYIEDNTIRVHVSRLREKLGSFDGDSYIETVRGTGYRWRAPVER
ncbi:MAG: response regulator transcription factor [Lachnospiraceae bacterium]|nr:response regulator transcription factor [Lachnospiraceae bacterium]